MNPSGKAEPWCHRAMNDLPWVSQKLLNGEQTPCLLVSHDHQTELERGHFRKLPCGRAFSCLGPGGVSTPTSLLFPVLEPFGPATFPFCFTSLPSAGGSNPGGCPPFWSG